MEEKLGNFQIYCTTIWKIYKFKEENYGYLQIQRGKRWKFPDLPQKNFENYKFIAEKFGNFQIYSGKIWNFQFQYTKTWKLTNP